MTVEELITLIRYKVDQGSAQQAETQTVGLATRIGSVFRTVASIAAPLAGGFGIYKVASTIFSATNEMEKYQTQFEVLLGGMDQAKERLEGLQKFADTTPFELPEIVRASKMLEVMTKGALSTGDQLRMVGDVSAGVGANFSELSMWFGRLYSGIQSGRPVGEAAMRMQELGVFSGEVRNKLEQMQKAGVAGDQVWKMLVTDSFGKYAGMTEKLAGTLGGKLSTMTDTFTGAARTIGVAILPYMKEVVTTITDFVAAVDWKAIAEVAAEVTKQVFGIVKAFAQLMPSKETLLGILGLFQDLVPLLPVLGGLLFGIVKAFAQLMPSKETLLGILGLFQDLVPLLPALGGLLILAFGPTMVGRIMATNRAIKAYAMWQTFIGRAAMTSATYQVTALGLVKSAWFSLSTTASAAWATMNTAITSTIGVLGGLIAVLGVAYYAYNKINEAADQRQKDEDALAARKRSSELETARNDLRAKQIQLQGLVDSKDKYFEGTRGKQEKAVYKKQLEEVNVQIAIVDKNLKAAQGYEAAKPWETGESFTSMMNAQLKQANNNSKQVTNNIKQEITVPVTVDDKGRTQLSRPAVEALINTSVRSAFNVELLGIVRDT